jgi:ADP-ribose pyrophosphatase YjhB (NUDIX family)
VEKYKNPFPTVDIIIEISEDNQDKGIVLIERQNPPHGWALPGGFVDYGESTETAARREALEETGLTVKLEALLGVYSRPDRDPRFHTLTSVYIASAQGRPKAGSDADNARIFKAMSLPEPICFDHGQILEHYLAWKRGQRSAAPCQK